MTLKLDEMLQRPENEFDLGEAALVLASEVPDIAGRFEIKRVLQRLDSMESKIEGTIYSMIRNLSPVVQRDTIISTLITCIRKGECIEKYEVGTFHLNRVLEDRKANCLGYTVLYLALAERMDLPLHGVFMPGPVHEPHAAVRWDDGTNRRLIEATSGQDYSSAYYMDDFSRMRNLTKKEVFSLVLYSNAVQRYKKGDNTGALMDLERAMRVYPDHPEAQAYKSDIQRFIGELTHAKPHIALSQTHPISNQPAKKSKIPNSAIALAGLGIAFIGGMSILIGAEGRKADISRKPGRTEGRELPSIPIFPPYNFPVQAAYSRANVQFRIVSEELARYGFRVKPGSNALILDVDNDANSVDRRHILVFEDSNSRQYGFRLGTLSQRCQHALGVE